MKLFKERYSYELPAILKMLGMTRICESSIEFKWGYISFGNGPELQLDHSYEEGIPRLCFCPIWIALHIELPFLKQRYPDVNHSPQYGFQYHSKAIWWHWGLKNWAFYMPWDWTFASHHVMTNNDWREYITEYDNDGTKPYRDGRVIERHPYTYVLKSGEVQKRIATIYREKREWRWRWFKWLPYPKLINDVIVIAFDGEVGEESGTWKGGARGCSYQVNKNETMLECLRRMEAERKF